ncbi:MAG: hypothetical protein R2881_01375 [Eubacteriales bacterium]
MEKKWIQPVAGEQDSRKKEYAITTLGKSVVESEIKRLQDLVETGRKIVEGFKMMKHCAENILGFRKKKTVAQRYVRAGDGVYGLFLVPLRVYRHRISSISIASNWKSRRMHGKHHQPTLF